MALQLHIWLMAVVRQGTLANADGSGQALHHASHVNTIPVSALVSR